MGEKAANQIVLTEHALLRFRERVQAGASYGGLRDAFQAATLLPKNPADWPHYWPYVAIRRGCRYYYDAARGILYPVETPPGQVVVLTVLLPVVGHQPGAPALSGPILRTLIEETRIQKERWQIEISAHAKGSDGRRYAHERFEALVAELKRLRRCLHFVR